MTDYRIDLYPDAPRAVSRLGIQSLEIPGQSREDLERRAGRLFQLGCPAKMVWERIGGADAVPLRSVYRWASRFRRGRFGNKREAN